MYIDIRFAVFEIVGNGKCLNVLDLKLLYLCDWFHLLQEPSQKNNVRDFPI